MSKKNAWAALTCAAVLVFVFAFQQRARAQDNATAAPANSGATAAGEAQAAVASVPRLIKFSGAVTDASGKPATGPVALTFTLYNAQQEGVALWTETQSVQLDSEGHYSVLLGAGSAEGLPLDLFTSGSPLWLGVQPGLPGTGEQPRVLLVAVPYALKAADADTLGGKPASAYLLSQGQTGASSASISGGATVGTAGARSAQSQKAGGADAKQNSASSPNVAGIGVTNFIPLWTTPVAIGDSVLFQTSAGNVGVGTTKPGARVDADGAGIAVRGTSAGPGGTGVFGNAIATSGSANGVYGQSASPYGTGVFGNATANTGNGTGVYGQTSSPGAAGVVGVANVGAAGLVPTGVYGTSSDPNGNGVGGGASATSGFAAGVSGSSASTSGTGVSGYATAGSGLATGVIGQTYSTGGFGVWGDANAVSGNTIGVYGESESQTGTAIFGNATSTSGATFGVSGAVESPNGTGVSGANNASSGGVGVSGVAYATSGGPIGVYGGTSGTDNGIAVWGAYGFSPTSSGGVGVKGSVEAEAPWGVSGQFVNVPGQGLILGGYSGPNFTQVFSVDPSGNLDISGSITVAGKKSARVKLPDGREVALYAVESPENWFEDFGIGQLRGGAAEVALDPEFLQTVDTASDYHVFLTPRGDCHGLYVASTTPGGFQVRELGGGSASIAFDYRIVAKRRGFETVRLEEVHVPQGPKDMAARSARMQRSEHMVAPPPRPPMAVPQPRKIAIPPMPHPAEQTH
ncbi:MAG TPA: hypothetical protein VMT20_27125 [Terriglobia bacterium]|nr:hypothetical protein [Terriglobia bacterium]